MQTLINNITTLIFLLMILIMLVIALGIFMIFKSSKRGNSDKRIPLQERMRKDAESLVPIEDIRDNMIIEKGGKCFLAVITCLGTDFYTKNRDEKIAIQNNYIDFIFALEEPITFRQYDEGVNLDYTIEKLKKVYHEIEAELFNRTENYRELFTQYQSGLENQTHEQAGMRQSLAMERKKLESLQWRLDHIKNELTYLDRVSGGNSGNQRQKLTYVVSWEPDMNQKLSNLSTPLLETAERELNRLCQVKIRQLSDAGAIARRATTKELIDMCRRHAAPYSSNLYSIDQVLDSTYFDDITTTDMLDRRNEAFDQDVANQILNGGSHS
jgi:hypothetical protein